MSFNPLMTLLTAALVERLEPDPTVVELGNQRFRPGTPVLKEVVRRLGDVARVDQASVARLLSLSKKKRLPMTEEFYRALGFSDYVAIDVNDKYGSLVMDLNCDLRSEYDYTEQFSLVTNNGTGEHVFDQSVVFANIHNLCRPGGVMLHVMPFVNWINHGFYSFHPGLYFDLAAANSYRVELIGFADRDGAGVVGRAPESPVGQSDPILMRETRLDLDDLLAKTDFRLLKPTRRAGRALLRLLPAGKKLESRRASFALTRALADCLKRAPARKVLVFAALVRTNEDDFKTPFQGLYSRDIADEAIRRRYDTADVER